MSKAEILTKLNAKTQSFSAAPGGVPELTQSDVAAMMQGLSNQQEWILRAKVLDDAAAAGNLWNWWKSVCREEARVRKWKRKSWQLNAFAAGVFAEAIQPGRCNYCLGQGAIQAGPLLITCDECGGTGVIPKDHSDRNLARSLGLSRLQEPWKSRAQWARIVLKNLEADAIANFGRWGCK